MQCFAQGYLFFKFPQRTNVWNSWHFDVANVWYDRSNFSFHAQHISFYFFSITVFVPWNEIYDLGQSVERFVRNFHSFFDCPLTTLFFYRTPSRPAPFRPNRSKPPWTSSSNKTLHSSSSPYHEEILIMHTFPYTYIIIHPNKKSEKSGRNKDEIYPSIFQELSIILQNERPLDKMIEKEKDSEMSLHPNWHLKVNYLVRVPAATASVSSFRDAISIVAVSARNSRIINSKDCS